MLTKDNYKVISDLMRLVGYCQGIIEGIGHSADHYATNSPELSEQCKNAYDYLETNLKRIMSEL